MKRVLGLDLGTTSIGWAVVDQAASQNEKSNIIQLGVRVNPITVDEQSSFENGKSITTTADRTLKRGMRRSLQRYKQRHVLPSLLCHPIQRYKFESNSQPQALAHRSSNILSTRVNLNQERTVLLYWKKEAVPILTQPPWHCTYFGSSAV